MTFLLARVPIAVLLLNLTVYWVVLLAGLVVLGHAMADDRSRRGLAWIGLGILTLPFMRVILWMAS